MRWMLMPFRRAFDYSGRSGKKEFFAFFLVFLVAIPIGLSATYPATQGFDTANAGSGGFLIAVATYMLLVLIPAVSLFVRRLHDSDLSGWWALFLLVPGLGLAGMIAEAAWVEGTSGWNRFGPDPRNSR
jgi:uncharacterized membrane protein YhaH (DUF805 family)